jgi:hypothetical protein
MCIRMMVLALVAAGGIALAADAETSASAGRNGGTRTAEAAARHEGRAGFSRTETRTGPVSTAQGVAVGVDEDGLAISLSTAVDPRMGPSVASNLNVAIGRDGQIATSGGLSLAEGPFERVTNAGGWARVNDRFADSAATAGGRTDSRGTVHGQTFAETGGVRHERGERPHGYCGGARRLPTTVDRVRVEPKVEHQIRPVYRRLLSEDFDGGKLGREISQRRTLAQDFAGRDKPDGGGRKVVIKR